jgi:hypothetical protein
MIHYSEDMVKLLLVSGANPNHGYKDSTVWLRFVAALADLQVESDRSTITNVVKALVAGQATLNASVTCTQGTKTAESALREWLSADEQEMVPELRLRSQWSDKFTFRRKDRKQRTSLG